jgi:DNA-binding NarL/FixJ family response regulator
VNSSFVRRPSIRVRSIRIVSGAAHVLPGVTSAVENAGLRVSEEANVALIIDAPVGFALHALETTMSSDATTIVSTTNTSPEYVEDLWDYRPNALIAGQNLSRRLPEILDHLDRGESFRLAPGCQTSLTPSERLTLRYLARGWSNLRIARQLAVRPQTVMNALTRIYVKLDVAGREEAILNYWGVWRTLLT